MSLNLSNIINFRTFRTEGKEWIRFGKVLFLVPGLPLLFLIAVLEIIGWRTGETVPFTWAAHEQAQHPDLLWLAGKQQNYACFKMARVAEERPDVLVLGQSRLGQLRGAMMRPYSFYNMSRISWPMNTYTEILRHLPPGYNPKVIIFDLDYFMFNPLYPKFYSDVAPEFEAPGHYTGLCNVFLALRDNPGIFFANRHSAVDGQPALGLSAHRTSGGFRQDGSEVWPLKLNQQAGRDPDMLNKVEWDGPQFFPGDTLDAGEMAHFEEFVTLAHNRGIALIGIQMPMYAPLVRSIEQNPRYGILKDFRSHVAKGYFDRLGVIVFDDLTFLPYSDDYRYFINAIHPTEAVNAAIVLKMASDPRVKALLPRLDAAALQRKLEEEKSSDRHVELYRNDD